MATTMATKEQERKALEQIKKIVESLGENSYVATAFEGCFEVAADNIENDFACSMKQRAESAEKKAVVLEQSLKDATDRINRTVKAININNENATSEFCRLEEDLSEARKKALDPWLYKQLWSDYTARVEEHKKRMEELADQMADHAEHPKSAAFRTAVSYYRVRKESREICEQVIRALELMEPAGV